MGKIFTITTRREFFRKVLSGLGLAALLPVVSTCKKKTVRGGIVGPDVTLGHRLRTGNFPEVTKTLTTEVVIVGGGVSGLAAARELKKAGIPFQLLELHSEGGGNAIGGKSDVSAYPWGAHYLPLPLHTDTPYLNFLREAGVITGMKDGLPVYNEYYICFDPKERLLINNYWQDGLTPTAGVPEKDLDEIQRFLSKMEHYKQLIGSDGRDAFAIPVRNSSADPAIRELDNISMNEYLTQEKFQSGYLYWYINYCCLDDFGSALDETSAWAAIHYFASRKGRAANVPHDSVLTWPEGNHWLVKKLTAIAHDHIATRSLVYNVVSGKSGAEVKYFDAGSEISVSINCSAVIMATPQFITQRLLGNHRPISWQYSPWVVANITLTNKLNERRGEELSWDNVIYGSHHLGYIHANHQGLSQPLSDKRVITYYRAFSGPDVEQRKKAYETSYDDWRQLVLNDLSIAHPGIEESIEQLDVYVWGHGMVKPYPGFIWNPDRLTTDTVYSDRIHFAHSDLSGISIFEEAFHNGITAAKKIISNDVNG
jgi:hypothetical protein